MTFPTPTYDPLNSGNYPGDGPLRIGGVSAASPVPVADGDLPSRRSEESKEMLAAVEMLTDLYDGPDEVRAAGTRYLPSDPGESPADYKARLNRSVYFNAVRQTVAGIMGFIFRRDPQLSDDVPEEIVADWENIDGMGTHGDVFAREIATEAFVAGHAGILVEFPKTEGRQTYADEIQRGVRPYWVPIEKENILSWRTEVEGGRRTLSQLVLEECQMVPDGAFGEKEQERYRVLRRLKTPFGTPLVTFEVLEVTDDRRVIQVDAGVYANQTEIPFVEVRTPGSEEMLESRPPLLDLAYLNIAHYQQWSDYATSLHKTCVPIFTTIGAAMPARGDAPADVVLGPNTGLALPAGGDAKYVAHDGQALGACKQALDDLKGDMATLGLAMLAPSKRAAETAEAKRIDKAATDSAIAIMARALQDALETALQFHANYLKLPEGGSVTINRDYENTSLDPRQVTALSQLVAQGQLSIETLWKALAEGNVLPDDFDAEDEKAMLAADEAIKAANAPPPPAPVIVNNQPPANAAAVDMQYGPDGKLMRMVRASDPAPAA